MKATINKSGDVTLVIGAAEVVAFRQGMLTAASPASYGNSVHAWDDVIKAHETAYNLVAALVAPAPVSKKPYVCNVKGCYKFGHAFSERGWKGDGTTKGHIEVSPAHK